jgi:hypothetical protein
MCRFATAGHLISWAGLCPKNDESAGKRRSNRMKKGAPWLKTTLIRCAGAASRKKNSYLQAQYLRIRSRRGAKKAIGAVAAYHMLKDGTLKGYRRGPFRQPSQRQAGSATRQPSTEPRIRCSDHPAGGLSEMLVSYQRLCAHQRWPAERKAMINQEHKLALRQAELLEISRSSPRKVSWIVETLFGAARLGECSPQNQTAAAYG